MSLSNASDAFSSHSPFKLDANPSSGVMAGADVKLITSGGLSIPAHASILASMSPVLESIIDRPRKHRSSERTIPILGVPCEAVKVFVQFIYSSRCTKEEMEKYGIHLLALSHMYLVPQLKQRCTKGLAERLTIENVVDVLQLARLCDAPDLYLRCMKKITHHFKGVEETEGWTFLQNHDPWLELDILQFIDDTESRKKKSRRHKEDQSVYLELTEALECLEHICTQGCTIVGPRDVEVTKKDGPCDKFSTCQGIQLSIKHLATCEKRVKKHGGGGGGCCLRCKRIWQLLKLHSSVCDQSDLCRVPLCREFRRKEEKQEKKGEEDGKWSVLVRKVVSAKAISSLSLSKRKRSEDEPRHTTTNTNTSNLHHGIRSFKL